MYLHKTKNGHYTPPCCYFSGELEVVECLPQVIEKQADYLEGRIIKYKSDRSAQIRAYNMEVFFSPSGQNSQSTPEDVNKKVKFDT